MCRAPMGERIPQEQAVHTCACNGVWFVQDAECRVILQTYMEATAPHVKKQRDEAKYLIAKYANVKRPASKPAPSGTLAPAPTPSNTSAVDSELATLLGRLGLSELLPLWLPPTSVVIGDEIGRGATGQVHKGTWGNKQVRES